jgi:uncharacterized UBP type Zn finger protein
MALAQQGTNSTHLCIFLSLPFLFLITFLSLSVFSFSLSRTLDLCSVVDLDKKKPADGESAADVPVEPYPPPIIIPNLLKAAVANGHPEFSSKGQQDAYEYLLHTLALFER